MKERDIFGGIKIYSDPSYIFSGVKTPNFQGGEVKPLTPRIYAPTSR